MAIFLALLTAAIFGVGDFFGGMTSKRARVLQVVAGSHLVGAVSATLVALLIAERFDWGDIGLGVVGGAFGVLGVGLLYRRLAVGPMSVVAPLTAISSAVVPAAWGILGGERLSSLGWAGLGLGLVAVVLVSLVSSEGNSESQQAEIDSQVVIESLLAGVGFGTMFIFLDATDASSAPWPVASARIFTSSMAVGLLLIMSRRRGRPVLPPDRSALGLIALVGLLDTGSNVTFLYASNAGQLAVVSVLASLYPVSTVILARLVLAERMTRYQAVGFVAALLATIFLGIG